MQEVNKSENIESIKLPDEFKDLCTDKTLNWFIMETVYSDTKIQKSVKFIFPTRMENGIYGREVLTAKAKPFRNLKPVGFKLQES